MLVPVIRNGTSFKTGAPKLSAALNFLWLLSLFQDKESNKALDEQRKNEKDKESNIALRRSKNEQIIILP
jgi:hypothetical protein